ncbi:hypothetical protein TWF594_006345, partial [Orbilia oligospora]
RIQNLISWPSRSVRFKTSTPAAKRWFQGSPTSWSSLPGYRFSLVPAPQISDFKGERKFPMLNLTAVPY